MARRLRIQFPGALYHVFNRGNYRRDVFETVGAASVFEAVLDEASTRHEWRIHAHVLMRNHYHLALETPAANLVEGMHWLQSTFATRFNRYRDQRGHLFQGRYHALLVEDAAVLARVVDYVHLNPVRAGLVQASTVAAFRWGSLRRFVNGTRPAWLAADFLLPQLQLEDTAASWALYIDHLIALAGDVQRQQKLGFDSMCRGWAIGSIGWRRALAREYSHFISSPGYGPEELNDIRETRWHDELQLALTERGISARDITPERQPSAWKVEVAAHLRHHVGAPYRWIAATLSIEHPQSLRMQVHRHTLRVSA